MYFSTGADSIVVLDLAVKHLKHVKAVYFYKVEGISFREKILSYYEKRYGIEVLRWPHLELMNYQNDFYSTGKPKVRQPDVDLAMRRKFNMSWILTGIRAQDGMVSRLMVHEGYSEKHKRGYPIGFLTRKEVLAYIKVHKLPLPVDYSYGFNNIDTYKGEPLRFVYQNFPEDYERIRRQYPFIEAEMVRMQ